MLLLLSADFLAHLSHWLMVSDVRRQQLLQMTSPPKLMAGFRPNLVGMILIRPALEIVQMVPVHCISRSHTG